MNIQTDRQTDYHHINYHDKNLPHCDYDIIICTIFLYKLSFMNVWTDQQTDKIYIHYDNVVLAQVHPKKGGLIINHLLNWHL